MTVAGVNCYMPANGETVLVPVSHSLPVTASISLLKRQAASSKHLVLVS